MDRRPDSIELFQALQAVEVEARAQHTSLGGDVYYSSSGGPVSAV